MAWGIGRVGAWLELRGRSGCDYACGGLGGGKGGFGVVIGDMVRG